MAKTVVGLYDDRTTALRAMKDLEARGFNKDHLSFASTERGDRHNYERDADSFRDPSAFTRHGVPNEEAEFYAEGLRRGGSLIVARVHDSNAEEAADIMARHNPARYEQRTKAYRESGFERYDRNAANYSEDEQRAERERYAGDRQQRFQEIEEHLKVGKREVVRGGVRVHQHVDTEREEETLRLREEHVDVDRRNVDRTLSPEEADRAFQEGSVEITERAEEAVVTKEAHVTGEVAVGKTSDVRTETVGADVRRTRVEVEQISGEEYERHSAGFRQHYDQHYVGQGRYEDYEPAYRYGAAAASTYSGRDYADVERDLERDYSDRYGDRTAWQKVKDAVRHGWDSVRGRR
jgi:stress response protein YsnF